MRHTASGPVLPKKKGSASLLWSFVGSAGPSEHAEA
jgi:hypothetical protein